MNVPEKVEPLKPHGEVVEAQMDNVESLMKICEGVDTVLHFAGQPSANARWDSLLKENIEGYGFESSQRICSLQQDSFFEVIQFIYRSQKIRRQTSCFC